MKCRIFTRSVMALSFCFLLMSSTSSLAQFKGNPVKKEKLVKVIRMKQLSTREIVAVIKTNGVDFKVTPLIEAELSGLDAEERQAFLAEMGLEEPGLNRLIREGYKLLGLVTYFTVGPKEARAWTITEGTKAPKAAGVIHTDFEKGFIRAETIAYPDYVALKGETGAKEAGKMRAEGKEYVVRDGDVLNFLFNV